MPCIHYLVIIVVVAFQGITGNSSTTVSDKLTNLSKQLKQELMILSDIGYLASTKQSSKYYLLHVCDVMANCGKSRIVVANNQWRRHIFKKPYVESTSSLIVKFKPCQLLNFSECEAKLYLRVES